MVNSVRFISEIRLSSFYFHLDVFHIDHRLRYTTSNSTTDSTEYATVRRKKNVFRFRFVNDFFSLVYKWFLLVYKVSYGLAIAGYFLIMMTFLGINNLFLVAPQVRRTTIKKKNVEKFEIIFV